MSVASAPVKVRLAVRTMIVLSVLVALASFRFTALGWELAFPDFAPHLDVRWWAFTSHVVAASVALLFGALQFIEWIRRNRPVWHRWSGRLYLVAVLVGGVGGLVLAIDAIGGAVAGAGFGLLALLWIGCTVQGVRCARARRFADHRRWMIRSFALTFAAVTLRLYLAGFMVAGVGYAPASVILAWICWVPNLLFAQWWLSRHPGLARA